MILLDTSVLIELFRTSDKQKSTFFKLSENHAEFAISAVTYYELFIGINDKSYPFWQKLIEKINIIDFDFNSAKIASEIYNDLKKNNKLIDTADIFIASTAINKKIPIATLNKKHFKRIKGLELI